MFEYIRGSVANVDADYVVIEAGGFGYRIFMANPAAVPAKAKDEVKLYLHQVIREDAHQLYGFLTREERNMFRYLLGVSGIGPKGALAILNGLTPQQIALAIVQEDVKRLKALPGIGQKTAQRLILDLKDKLKGAVRIGMGEEGLLPSLPASGEGEGGVLRDALDALLVLGYHDHEVSPLLSRLFRENPGLAAEEYIRLALTELGRR